MKASYKIIFIFLSAAIIVVTLFPYSFSQYVTHQDNQLDTQSNSTDIQILNHNNTLINVQEPIKQEQFINLTSYSLKFILYEDFPLHTSKSLDSESLRLANLPYNSWAKVIINEKNQSMLRITGYVMPGKATPFNNTLFLIPPSNAKYNFGDWTTISLVKNNVLEKIDVLQNLRPIRFNDAIFAYPNSTFGHIFGIVYDISNDSPNLKLDIEPIGMISNNTLSDMPNWLKIETMKLPLTLNPNQPNYYIFNVSTFDAKPGSYEIAFREHINNQMFVETATLIILQPQE